MKQYYFILGLSVLALSACQNKASEQSQSNDVATEQVNNPATADNPTAVTSEYAVMSFKTLSALFAVRDKSIVSAKAFSRFSSANNEKTGHFDFNLGFRKWSFLTSVTYSDYGDLKMGTHGPDEYLRNFYVIRMDSVDRVVSNPNPLVQNPTGYNQINLMQKIRFQVPNWNTVCDVAFIFCSGLK
jgi:hypothetical protein